MPAKKITIDDLALMVSKGFTETREYMDKRFDSIEDRLSNLEKGFEEMKAELFYIRAELSKRVDKFSHKDLEFRVEKLEEKLKKYEKLLVNK